MAYTRINKNCPKCKSKMDNRAKQCKKCYYKSLVGKKNPNFGRKYKKTYYCIKCGKKVSRKQYLRCHSCAMKYLLKTNKKLIIYNKNKFGTNNPNWLGGKSFEPYSYKFNNSLKTKIKNRDNYMCQLCNHQKNLVIHHIDYNKKNNSEDNLITLCNKCNVRANYNRKYWKEYFKNKIGDIYVSYKS